MANENKEQKKKKSGKVVKGGIVLLIIAALIGGGWKIGLFPGGKGGSGSGGKGNEVTTAPSQVSTTAHQEETTGEVSGQKVHKLKVQGDLYFLDGTEKKAGELSEALKALDPKSQIILIDAKAVTNAYEAALKAVKDSGLSYKESTD